MASPYQAAALRVTVKHLQNLLHIGSGWQAGHEDRDIQPTFLQRRRQPPGSVFNIYMAWCVSFLLSMSCGALSPDFTLSNYWRLMHRASH